MFAVDGSDRIVLWNKKCEALLGKPARSVLGKRCYEVLGGRDVNGNLYCHRGCPVAYQAREMKAQPVKPFELTVKTGEGTRISVSNSLFALPDYHPALTRLVHVLRPAEDRVRAEVPRPQSPERMAPAMDARSELAALSGREREILRCLVKGTATAAIARQLSIARVTVRNHVQSLLQKLNVHSKLEAVALANRLKFA